MHRCAYIIVMLLCSMAGHSQVIFKTELDRKRVPVGESFLVQYLLEDVDENDGFSAPFFKDFRLVSGPRIYRGSVSTVDGVKSLKNISFTLEAVKTGRFIIPGATASVNGKFIKSDEQVIEVISKTEYFDEKQQQGDASISDYFLAPGEDPHEKIRKNLFLKVQVDKRSCYVGEPVVATFKLYSRLESRSDIIKNPGFYGFAVHDMIGINDKVSTTESVQGRAFDVHTVRKVQLYPLQAGTFMVDAMEVANKVEFSRSVVNRKTEQMIVEGVLNSDDRKSSVNTVSFENNLSTEPIAISVKDYPEKNKPASFAGATGKFSIKAELEKAELSKNEKGELVVTIQGNGNLTQLVPPSIQWPAGFEAFEPVVSDEFDKSQAPLKGRREFHFPFVANKPGNYVLPAISLAVFDPDTNSYKTVTSSDLTLTVNIAKAEEENLEEEKKNQDDQPRYLWWAIIAAMVAAMALLISWRLRKKEKEAPVIVKTEQQSIEELLLPAEFALKANDNQFYKLLQNSIRDYLTWKLKISAGHLSRSRLLSAMKEQNLPEQPCQDLIYVLQECETALFTKSAFAAHKEELFQISRKAMIRLKNS